MNYCWDNMIWNFKINNTQYLVNQVFQIYGIIFKNIWKLTGFIIK
jgi:hypothetical protein